MTRFEAAAWLTAPSTLAVLDALEAAGGAGCVRVVGGAVRNALMGRPVEDVDLATTLWPDQVIAALKTAGLKAVPTGLAHGTVTAVSGGRGFEVTTLRRDVATDGRHAVVTFTDDWAEDAARRDFRLNALYVDREGRVFDPTGEGVADALAGRVVFVGDPARRITEDYLRILRFFRFSAGRPRSRGTGGLRRWTRGPGAAVGGAGIEGAAEAAVSPRSPRCRVGDGRDRRARARLAGSGRRSEVHAADRHVG